MKQRYCLSCVRENEYIVLLLFSVATMPLPNATVTNFETWIRRRKMMRYEKKITDEKIKVNVTVDKFACRPVRTPPRPFEQKSRPITCFLFTIVFLVLQQFYTHNIST